MKKALGISMAVMAALTVASSASADTKASANAGLNANVNLGGESGFKARVYPGTTSRGWDKDNDGDRDDGKVKKDHATSTPILQGNGQPVIAGTITAVSGDTVTVTTKNNVVYTVNALTSKIYVGNNATSTSALTIGGTVVVQGTVNGNSVMASSIIQQKSTSRFGFFGGIGMWFRHLFGF